MQSHYVQVSQHAPYMLAMSPCASIICSRVIVYDYFFIEALFYTILHVIPVHANNRPICILPIFLILHIFIVLATL